MNNKRWLVVLLLVLVFALAIILINSPSENQRPAITITQQQNITQNIPNSSITLSISPTPEVPAVPLNDFLANCGKSSDSFVAQINTYSDHSLDDNNWINTLNTRLVSVEKECTNLAISDSSNYPSQVLYLRALSSQKFLEAIALFQDGINIKEKTIILAAISKFRDATNLLIGTSYYASSLADVTPPSVESTRSIDEQTAEKEMNEYVIGCSPAAEELNAILGLYSDQSLTDPEWILTFTSKLDAFDQACSLYSTNTPPIELYAVDYIFKMGSQKCAETSLTLRESINMVDPLGFVLGTSQFNDARFLLAGAVAYGK